MTSHASARHREPQGSASPWAPAVKIPTSEQAAEPEPPTEEKKKKKEKEDSSPPSSPPRDPLICHLQSYLTQSPAKYPSFRSLLFRRHSRPQALVLVLVAVLANHVRRVLAPWLGQFLFYHLIDDLKLARAVPYQLLEAESLGFSWASLAWWTANVLLVAVLESGVTAWLTLKDEDLQAQKTKLSGRNRVNTDIALVGYLCLRLTGLEYAFTATFWTLGILYAYGALVAPTPPTTPDAASAFLWRLVRSHYTKLPIQAALVLNVVVNSVIASVNAALLGCLRGRPALAVYLAAWTGLVVHVVRHSSRYFVLIEMSDLAITWVEIGVAVGWVAIAGGKQDEEPRHEKTS